MAGIDLSAGGGAVRFAHACSTCQIRHRSELGDRCATLTIKLVQNFGEAIHRFHYDCHQQLNTHLNDFIDAYNFARKLKTLNGLTPYEFLCKSFQNEPEIFNLKPFHQFPGPYS